MRTFIETELDTYTYDLSVKPTERGRIAQGAALAIRMREALYYGDWSTAKTKAQEIIDLQQYDLEKVKKDIANFSKWQDKIQKKSSWQCNTSILPSHWV